MRNPGNAAVMVLMMLSAVACRGAQTAPTPDVDSRQAERRAASTLSPELVQDRQIVRNGQMVVEVTQLDAARTRFEQATASLAGHVVTSRSEDKRAELLVRVPAARLHALMDSVSTLGDVEMRRVTSADVTDQLVDLEARLGAVRATRDRLRQLLERADEVQDVIAVERELGRVQADLESLEARLQLLRGQVAMSELSVRLRQEPVLGPLGVIVAGAAKLIGKLFVWR